MPRRLRAAVALARRADRVAMTPALDDLAAAHHHTATELAGMRDALLALNHEVVHLRAAVDPERSNAVADTVEALLPLVERAVTSADEAVRRLGWQDDRVTAAEQQLADVRGRMDELTTLVTKLLAGEDARESAVAAP